MLAPIMTKVDGHHTHHVAFRQADEDVHTIIITHQSGCININQLVRADQ